VVGATAAGHLPSRDLRFTVYPGHTDEKRWVDGVLAWKKGLEF
jgi:hypothetical protein